ncbi:MAG: class I SAM-dependent methyltransferase, partial [Bdellovibrionales bacterium]|nr:class I SAM-dependent methyltransferase [Bdellovibrionales bacterium]
MDAKPCQATHYRILDLIFKKGLNIAYSEINFIDVGCGLGRVVHYASDYPFKRIIGLDIGENIIELAEKNIKNRDITLLTQDVLDYVPPTGKNIYFLYNPFNARVL